MSLIRQSRPALATVAALAGIVGVQRTVQAALGSRGHTAVAQSPEFLAWSAFVSVSVVIYIHVFVRTVRVVRPPSRAVLAVSIIAYLLVGGVVLKLLTGHGPAGTLDTVPLVMRPLYAVAEVAAAPAVIGLWLVHARLRQVDHLLEQWPERSDPVLTELLRSRTDLRRCLAGLSLIASTALINTAALRKAHLAYGLRPEQFPSALVLLYGAAVTAIVALIYVPAFLAWRERATNLISTVYPVPADARPSEEWTSGRARLSDLVGVDATVAKTLGAAFGILAPLATSLLSVYIPELKPGP
ncbi:hypothetical protein [Micromonospora sp. NPDC005806]|uniref:hypothetical protein n=1 Tax=Micromonospora sp. NPDC005806 TaxID=3364234 RepID=UPI0036CA5A49